MANTVFRCLKCLKHRPMSANYIYQRRTHSKVPLNPTWKQHDESEYPKIEEVSTKQVDQLERLGLIELNNEEGIKSITAAIQSANCLHVIDTTDVKPLDTILENTALYLREDKLTDGNCKKDVLMNAVKVEEDYFVAPPGNIPLKFKDKG